MEEKKSTGTKEKILFLIFTEGRRFGYKTTVKCYVAWFDVASKLGQFTSNESVYVSRYEFDSQWQYDGTKVIKRSHDCEVARTKQQTKISFQLQQQFKKL